MNFLAIIWLLAVMTIIVFIHELGHFSVARFFGVKIDVFAIGFGKKLWSWLDSKGTRWCICLIPLGGYVKMHGEMVLEDQAKPPEGKDLFINKPLWQKAAIVVAGPLANYILAIVVLAIIFTINGQVIHTNEVTGIASDGPAAIAGVQAGDVIAKINEQEVHDIAEIHSAISKHYNIAEPVDIIVLRENNELKFSLLMKYDQHSKRALLGLEFGKIVNKSLSPIQALKDSVFYSGKMTIMMLDAIGQMITGKRGTDEIGSLGRIADYTTKSMAYGWVAMWSSVALLSLNLGLLNLLPIPVLDGGYLFYYAIQAIIRRPIPYKVQMAGMRVGLFVVLSLMCIGIFNDIKEFILK